MSTKMFLSEEGNILDVLERDSYLIGHGVNCQGVMGSGVARVLYEAVPEVRSTYLDFFVSNKHHTPESFLGLVNYVNVGNDRDKLIANCFTQVNFGSDGGVYADPVAIRNTVYQLLKHAHDKGIDEVHIPLIGYGLGGLGRLVFDAFNEAVESYQIVCQDSRVSLVVLYRAGDITDQHDLEYLKSDSLRSWV